MYFLWKKIIFIFIKTIFLLFLVTGISFLIKSNIQFANYICEITKIPKDFAITTISPGYANEIIFILTVFEVGIILIILQKINNYSFFAIL